MMRKLLVGWIAGMLTILVIKNLWICCGFNELSDEEIMDKYINENHNEQCYGVLQECDNDEYIDFIVYENGCVKTRAMVMKSHYDE